MSDIEQRVKKIVAEQLGVAEADIKNESSFVEDLGADSLDNVELVMALEEEFETEIPDEDAEKITTVQQAIDYITERRNQEQALSHMANTDPLTGLRNRRSGSDLRSTGCSGTRSFAFGACRGRRGRCGTLALAVQLVEQGFELIVAERITGNAGSRDLDSRRIMRGRRGAGTIGHRDEFEYFQQIRIRRWWFAIGGNRFEHLAKPVERLEYRVEHRRIELALAGAQQAEDLFGRMRQPDHRVQFEEAGTTLERMKSAKFVISNTLF